jgi:CRP-like cAMP-binding protein
MPAIPRRAPPIEAAPLQARAPKRFLRLPLPTDNPRFLLDLAPHKSVIGQGDEARSIFIVLDGEVMMSKLLSDGRRQIVEVLGRGGVFGLTTTAFHDASVETLGRARIVAYDPLVVEASVQLTAEVARALSAQVFELHRHMLLLGRMSARERVASYLFGLTFGRGRDLDAEVAHESVTVRLPMRRADLADYVGLTTETVSRAFGELRKLGLIAYVRPDRVEVVEPARLARLAGFTPRTH